MIPTNILGGSIDAGPQTQGIALPPVVELPMATPANELPVAIPSSAAEALELLQAPRVLLVGVALTPRP